MFVYLSVIFKRLDSNTREIPREMPREMPPNLFLGHKVVYSTYNTRYFESWRIDWTLNGNGDSER